MISTILEIQEIKFCEIPNPQTGTAYKKAIYPPPLMMPEKGLSLATESTSMNFEEYDIIAVFSEFFGTHRLFGVKRSHKTLFSDILRLSDIEVAQFKKSIVDETLKKERERISVKYNIPYQDLIK